MSDVHTYSSDVAFTPAVKAIQTRKGAREAYARVEERGWRTEIDEDLAARVVDDEPALLQALMPKGYRARPEQVIVFRIAAWDTNSPQHIPQKFEAADVAAALAARDARIAELEAELAAAKGQPAPAR